MLLLDLSQVSPITVTSAIPFSLTALSPVQEPTPQVRSYSLPNLVAPPVLAQLSQFLGTEAGCCLEHRTQDTRVHTAVMIQEASPAGPVRSAMIGSFCWC